MITREQATELVKITLKDMPKLPIDLMISSFNGDKDDPTIQYILKNYSADEIKDALNRQREVLRMFRRNKL